MNAVHRAELEPRVAEAARRIRFTTPPAWGRAQARLLWSMLTEDNPELRDVLRELGV